MCCLCKDISKWLDFLVFSDEDEKTQVPSHSTFTDLFIWDVREPTPMFEKSRGRRARWCGPTSLDGLWDWVGMAPCMGPISPFRAHSLWTGLCPGKLIKQKTKNYDWNPTLAMISSPILLHNPFEKSTLFNWRILNCISCTWRRKRRIS